MFLWINVIRTKELELYIVRIYLPLATALVPATANDAIDKIDAVITTRSIPSAFPAESSIPTVPLTAGWI
jgi:hypothetical protein